MPYFKTCRDCGANNDPGERCDCQDEIEVFANERLFRRRKTRADCVAFKHTARNSENLPKNVSGTKGASPSRVEKII